MENLSTDVPVRATAGEKISRSAGPVKKRRDGQRTACILLTVAPSLVLFIVFVIFPVINMFYTSLFTWDGIGEKLFVKFDNYQVLFHSDDFWTAFKNTVFLIFTVTIFTIVLALFFAAVLSKGKTKGKTFFRIVFYIPNILSIVVISAIFSALLAPSYGVIGAIANLFDKSYTGWLGDTDAVMWCIAFAMVWQAVGYYMVMYIAGMDSVPDHLYEAADLEGCGKLRQFFMITVPLTWEVIRTTLTFFIISTINMSFLFVDAMTQGEANSHVLLSFMYKFYGSQYGYAMAIGTVVFVFAYGVSLIIQRLTRREIIQY